MLKKSHFSIYYTTVSPKNLFVLEFILDISLDPKYIDASMRIKFIYGQTFVQTPLISSVC